MHGYTKRNAEKQILADLRSFPVVAILGPRQCGKSTLAKEIGKKIDHFLYLDLESPSDLRKLDDPELFFDANKNGTICIDEIQRRPELFPVLRSIIDRDRWNGRLIILGSASVELIKQGSETLAGRISFIELTPFVLSEVKNQTAFEINDYWLRGGYPESYLAENREVSNRWRDNFIKTFIERDIPQFGINIPSAKLSRFLAMLAHNHGQILNSSRLGSALGVNYHAIQHYIALFEQMFIVRSLQPYMANLKKRLIKSPKVFIRDAGILHALLNITDFNNLLGNPMLGLSWEGFVVENILSELPGWRGYFYRTSNGAEIDLVLEKGRKRIGIECKASKSPHVSQGFWNSLEDLGIEESWVIAPINEKYKIKKNAFVSSLGIFIEEHKI